jgi:hypothetical protein
MSKIQSYDHENQRLAHSQSYKVRRILENHCLEQVNENLWVCKPIEGYNSRTYKLSRVFVWEKFSCNCQGFNKKGICSHVVALQKYIKLNVKGQYVFSFLLRLSNGVI